MDRILTNGRKLLTSNNNKLLVSRERTTGQRSGLRFNGGFVEVPSNAVYNFINPSITICAWIKPDSISTSEIVYRKFSWGLRMAGTSLSFYFWNNGSSTIIHSVEAGFVKGRQYHIAGSWDGTSIKLYVDGIEIGASEKTGGIAVNTNNVFIGKNELDFNKFIGAISNPLIFNKALTLTEIKSYMHRYLPANTPNLIEQWKLNEGTGTIVYGTKGNNGTISGTATWTTPSLMNYVGKQLSLNGTSQYVNTALSLSGSYTKECWVNPSSIAGTDNILSGVNTGFQLVDGKLAGGHNGSYQQVSDTVTIAGHTHVAITYNDITKLLSLYKNGLLIASATSASYTASVQQIGAFGGANLFHGKLDDVRVWNNARTQTQIQENMNRTLGREPGLVLNLGFESDYYDASGYGNHGTPVGSPVLEVTDNDKLLLNAPIN
jgi:hypothetical protein